ncbi:hypothetical protein CYJ37_08285 [Bacillus sp. UMB0728]|nr:hypothetical protein CYJ37_08285 [Bacillus sp. UMB0728]
MVHSTFKLEYKSTALSLFIICIAALLHHSNVIYGINLSFADFFCILLLIYLFMVKQLYIPISPLICFLFLSVQVIVTASFYIPLRFDLFVIPTVILSDYLKLLALFGYFILGYNLSSQNLMGKLLKGYSISGILIGAAGIVMTFTHLEFYREFFFFGGTRYRGLMIDPNYYAVLQVTSLVFLTRVKTVEVKYKYIAVVIISLSVLISGSKTGLMTLGCYLIIRLLEYLFFTRKKIMLFTCQLLVLSLLLFITPLIFDKIQYLFNNIATNIPSFGRIYNLVTDFNGAITEEGSGRADTWKTALQIIQISPFLGVGIGMYTSLATDLFNFNNVAHNTFLQLSAEWGIPLALSFFVFIAFSLGKITIYSSQTSVMNLILRDIIIILLIGSLAISLNNARMLWLFLGATVYFLKLHHSRKPSNNRCITKERKLEREFKGNVNFPKL